MAARPAQDDETCTSSSGSSYRSDGYTLPGDTADDDDARSIASVSSYESYDSVCPRERLPSYRVPAGQGTSQPVYEAWVLCLSHETDHEVTKITSCGLDILSARDEEKPFVVSRTEPYEQDELAGMALASVDGYRAASRRGFAARLLRGRPKTYEQELDERLRRLPMSLQSNLNGLLRNREEASSNRFHRREWTVVMMREQYRYRFANAAPEPVKKKGLWKGKDSKRTEYLFVIRGAEGRVATDDKGMYQPHEFGNPWKRVDMEERLMRERSRDIRRFGKEYVQEGWMPRPRGRSLSPMPEPPRGPVPPPFRSYPPPPPLPHTVTIEPRGRPYDRDHSRRGGYSRSRSRSSSPSLFINDFGRPQPNPFVPLPIPTMGDMPSFPPTPGPYMCPAPGRFMPPPPAAVAHHHHLPPFGLSPFDHHMRSQVHGRMSFPIPPSPSELSPEPCSTWSPQPLAIPMAYQEGEPIPHADQQPHASSIPVQHHAFPAGPFPLEISSPPQSPRPSFVCMGGAPPSSSASSSSPPARLPTMDACHRLFDAEFCSPPPPPSAPKPSNLTTPTEFSPASSDHTGSTVQSTDATTPGGPGMDVFWE
ncbi:hypothetical protein Daus18300_012182 [Diaporthe australafricana]|uniref:Uncharacterized protein n=1 Tax=Diaporthe australafricana TaxID=127596 RepID=A0ABR3W3K2_9PEZI